MSRRFCSVPRCISNVRTLARVCGGSPGGDRRPTPLFGDDIAHRLGQLPAVTSQIFEDARTLAVLPGRQFFDDLSAVVAGMREGGIDVRDAHLDQMRHPIAARSYS